MRADPALAQEVQTLSDVLARVAAELASDPQVVARRFSAANRAVEALRANDTAVSNVSELKSPHS
jgi:hypothetical protein